jgi:16S rRNA processing protein RimM
MANHRPEPRYLAIGRIDRPFGVKGELKVSLLTSYPEELGRLETVYVGPHVEPWKVENVRLHKGAALFKLAGCKDRDAAEMLRGQLMQISIEDALPLEDEEYYEFQIIGMRVVEEDGTSLGKVVEIIDTRGANDVYVVTGPEGEILLPAIESVILEIDLEKDQMIVRLMEGLR